MPAHIYDFESYLRRNKKLKGHAEALDILSTFLNSREARGYSYVDIMAASETSEPKVVKRSAKKVTFEVDGMKAVFHYLGHVYIPGDIYLSRSFYRVFVHDHELIVAIANDTPASTLSWDAVAYEYRRKLSGAMIKELAQTVNARDWIRSFHEYNDIFLAKADLVDAAAVYLYMLSGRTRMGLSIAEWDFKGDATQDFFIENLEYGFSLGIGSSIRHLSSFEKFLAAVQGY